MKKSCARRSAIVPTLCLSSLLCMAHPAHAAVTLLDGDWKVKLGGFVEFDAINDSTRSLTEIIGNTPVDRSGSFNGSNGRTQFSIRNTRLGISVEAPKTSEGIATRGYFEFDFFGFDPNPNGSSTSTQVNTESGYFNNPTMRVRHAYIQATTESNWDFLVGQTWQVFGWQPYYFLDTINVSPIPGELYNRTTQARALKKFQTDNFGFQAVGAIMRPPQRDSSIPGFEAGLRATYDGRKSGYTGTGPGAQALQPLSLAVSGAFREFQMPVIGSPTVESNYPGSAIAVDGMLPVLASSDGKSVSNTMTLTGEFTSGTGYGDQFSAWSGNIASPLNSSTSANVAALNAAKTYPNLDAGIGDYDANGNFTLIHLQTWNLQLQYNFAEDTHTWVDLGHSRLYSNNINVATDTNGKVAYDAEEASFVNVAHDFTNHVRLALEYDFIRTHYVDGVYGEDNRYQMTAWFLF